MKFVVTTTINHPTPATLKFCELVSKKNSWFFLIIGDSLTPHDDYRDLEKQYPNFIYLGPDAQEELLKELSDSLGWRSIQRRNIGFVYAYHCGAEILATVDDDNIPYDNWGDNIHVGKEVGYQCFRCTSTDFFDPLSVTRSNHLWHRGYPVEHLQERLDVEFIGSRKKRCLVQANLWDGDPDIDAMARLTFSPEIDYNEITEPFGSEQRAPFNSQNTMLHRSVIPYYAVLPFVGRMDDIWGGYIAQQHFSNAVVYDSATVYQDRNQQDLITNLEDEILGYRRTLRLLNAGSDYLDLLPECTKQFYALYKQAFIQKDIADSIKKHFEKRFPNCPK